MDLLLATARKVGLFHDDEPLIAAFARHGITAIPTPWQDIAPGDSPVLVRTPWDYTDDREGFTRWLAALEAAGTPCVNPPALMQWNLDKRYLLGLQANGHAIVPTRILEAFDEDAARTIMADEGWTDAVAKPVVGAGAEGLVRLKDGDVEELLATGNTWLDAASARPQGPCMVQPFLSEVVAEGEWSLFFFGGRFSHAILKTPAPGDIRVQEEHGGSTRAAEPDAEVLEAAAAIVAEVPEAVYARVDGVVTDGRFLLMELELIEPELYFRYCPEGVPAFVEAVAVALAGA